jgi:hypothetical protein
MSPLGILIPGPTIYIQSLYWSHYLPSFRRNSPRFFKVFVSTNRLYTVKLNEEIVKKSEYMRIQKGVVVAYLKILSKETS